MSEMLIIRKVKEFYITSWKNQLAFQFHLPWDEKKRFSRTCHSRAGSIVACSITYVAIGRKISSYQTRQIAFKSTPILQEFSVFPLKQSTLNSVSFSRYLPFQLRFRSVEEVTSIRFLKKRVASLLITSFALIFVSVIFLSQAKETVGKVK